MKSLLPLLDEANLLRIAKLFDPSRPAAKTLLMKFSSTPRRQRYGSYRYTCLLAIFNSCNMQLFLYRSLSGGSQTSLDSYLSFIHDSTGSAISDLLELFLATIVVLNSKRHFVTFPDL